MIVPDVNILVYAFRADSAEHQTYGPWLNEALAHESIGVSDTILSGFVRIVTHPRITTAPAPIDAAMAFTRSLLAAPRTQWLTTGPRPGTGSTPSPQAIEASAGTSSPTRTSPPWPWRTAHASRPATAASPDSPT
ncbi:hypothetical protein [Microbacterium sp. Se63.02b]|uniref:hypothetical protein n=1 Tax=Microbacterium sp. Se63.02b TaxID=2709304 RepID=UPI00191EB0F4|nr:hypothetical protein [Microbacterium sp. Se63.02b]